MYFYFGIKDGIKSVEREDQFVEFITINLIFDCILNCGFYIYFF